MTRSLPPGDELLDHREADPALVALSLRNVARANRWFGGRAAVRYGVSRLLEGTSPGPVSLLDVGTGYADIPLDLVRWGAERGLAVRTFGVEWHPAAARVARGQGLMMTRADGTALPLRDRAVDLVVISQVAHHLPPSGIRALALEATRVARIGVVLADLHRSAFAALAFRVGSLILGFDRSTRVDGVTSVRRGFRAAELADLLRAAGLEPNVTYRPLARVVASWRV